MAITASGKHWHDLIGEALAASLLAGDAVMHVYESDFEVRYKKDQSPLTEADRQSHQILSARLGGGIPVLSEEGSEIVHENRKHWNLFWLIDPLDGTKEFVTRNEEFTINVALMEQNSPIAGIVYLPAKAILYFGGRGLGAHRIDGSSLESIKKSESAVTLESALGCAIPLPLRDLAQTPERIRIVQSISHVTAEEADFVGRLDSEFGGIETASAGSSLKFCLVAEGSADLYPRFGPTMEWDTAAGHCIAESAGCEILGRADLSPVYYNKPVLRNDSFLVMGPRICIRPAWRNAVLACVRAAV